MFGLYNILVFLTGFLILSIQLVFGKAVLPLFGGAPNVWLTSLAFYQTVLTLGYMYAYIMQNKVSLNNQIKIHSVMFLLSLLFIPIGLSDFGANIENESLKIFAITFLSIGFPYFILTASSPLLQSWFGNTESSKSGNPYILYVSSNLGTFLSLIIYPFLIEPMMDVKDQFDYWSILFIIEIILVLSCAYLMYKQLKNKKQKIIKDKEKIKINKIAFWIMCAFIPSALLSTITTKLTLDISPVPLLWVLPLAVYFLSYSFAFSDRFKLSDIFGILSVSLVIISELFSANFHNFYSLIMYIVLLFVASTFFHNKAYKNAPKKENLALFYFMLSIGGALGGMFVGVLSPMIFNDYYEYDILMFLVFSISIYLLLNSTKTGKKISILLILSYIIFLGFIFAEEKVEIYKERTFFGVYTVNHAETENYSLHMFTHGNTLHGAQLKRPASMEKRALTYYTGQNPLNISFVEKDLHKTVETMGVVGLGVGTMNCYKENMEIDYYEIDQAVVDIANNKELFTYMSACDNKENYIVGDARIEMKKEPNNKYDLLYIDAFSSDAIPIHLITKEAVQMYIEKIKSDGAVVFHISNRYLNLEKVLGNIAYELNLDTAFCTVSNKDKLDYKEYKKLLEMESEVVVLGANLDYLKNDCWYYTLNEVNKETGKLNKKVWTDTFSNLFDYIRFND